MAGFVNTSYSVVSQTRKTKLPIEKVTERYYMGYKRDRKFFEQVRLEFLNNKKAILAIIDKHEPYFENKKSFQISRDYIQGFFNIISNESKYYKNTYDKALVIK